jgi:HAD superfamily hydrolase (TIGR01509 family)
VVKAIVFDFDGVIIDSEKVRYDAWQAVFSLYGQILPLKEWLKNIGRASYAANPHEILEELTGLKIAADDLHEQAKRFELEFVSTIPALPGVLELIEDARSRNIQIAVASSSSRQWVEGHLKRLFVFDNFSTLVCREDTITHKPSPEPYLTAIKRLKCTPEESIAIEDSPLGINSAISAGLKCIAVGCSLTKQMNLNSATMQFSSLADFNLALLTN